MDEKIKVTDKRLFTAEGELREDLRDQEAGAAAGDRPESKPAEESPSVEPSSVPKTPEAPVPEVATPESPTEPAGEPAGRPGARDGEFSAPTFVDLIGLLAQPIALFLGDAALPDSEAEENLPLARFHIDLLEVVQSKTKGNLGAEESKLLEDLLYQLRMRYVEKAG